ncbi:PREDICTED: serine protease 30-like [Priapulus caudatus]|uniref:Serine protease 30-like n=1 Tax=Priapulus caudatus TaxID=37621 RepID=A0ABM1ERB1_PRICU|nr:PREDICTED: serine protease 30-like [Priapulus caudatus]XP_014674732.1 PREDICTED: serine protease 30-like [Priapulus caudatus]
MGGGIVTSSCVMLSIFILVLIPLSCRCDAMAAQWPWTYLFPDDDNSTESSPVADSEMESMVSVGNDHSYVNYNDIYHPWSDWSTCTHRCRQHRIRHCSSRTDCGRNRLKEVRSCFTGHCASHSNDSRGGAGPQRVRAADTSDHHYSDWSEWSPCTRTCVQRRFKECVRPSQCDGDIISEQRECAPSNSACERMTSSSVNRVIKPVTVTVAPELPESDEPLECGLMRNSTGVNTRIYGGRQSVAGRWPWQVALLNRWKEHYCGGVLIAPSYVLTAAHCVKKRMFAVLGEHDLYEREGNERYHRVAAAVSHPRYDEEIVDNDVALLRLASPARRSPPVCLPARRLTLPTGTPCVVLGWGKEHERRPEAASVLHEAEVPLVARRDCEKEYRRYHVSANMLCAGYKDGHADSCSGDSGGPLLCAAEGRWRVYGITSFGRGCGLDGRFGVYAKVSNFVEWIQLAMQADGDGDGSGRVSARGIRKFLSSLTDFFAF